MLTVRPVDDNNSPTPSPVPSQRRSHCEERQLEPISDQEPVFVVMFEPTPRGAIEQDITPERELAMSDQVCEPAVSSIAIGVLMEYDGMEAPPLSGIVILRLL